MQHDERGAVIGSILGIFICGVAGGFAAWSAVSALDLDGVVGALAAAVIGMVVATGLVGGRLDVAARAGPPAVTTTRADIVAIAGRLIAAYDGATTLAPITAGDPAFDVAAGYDVLHEIEARRRASGWQPVGRKIGFTNRTIWPRYGVYLPMWSHVWSHTAHRTSANRATLSLASFVQPRIEPEVVFRAHGAGAGRRRCAHYPRLRRMDRPRGSRSCRATSRDWKFRGRGTARAAFGLHGALVVGAPVPVTERNRGFPCRYGCRVSHSRCDVAARVIDTGIGANVLDSPALALRAILRASSRGSRSFLPLRQASSSRPGTITDAWPVTKGETWDVGLRDARTPRHDTHVRLTLAATPRRYFTSSPRFACQSAIPSSGYSPKCVWPRPLGIAPPTARRSRA